MHNSHGAQVKEGRIDGWFLCRDDNAGANVALFTDDLLEVFSEGAGLKRVVQELYRWLVQIF